MTTDIYQLESMQTTHPDAFSELMAMEPNMRRVMLVLLNEGTVSPPARGYAEYEVDKEDAIISNLRVNWNIEITSKKVRGNYCYHMMTIAQIHEFLHDRETMRKRVAAIVWAKRTRDLDRQLRKAIKWRGESWLVDRIGELAANDPLYDVEEQKEPKP
ncbi:hypothetical protein L2750_04765 [Shewanella submarina]|uniref:Uncharacterized protein n=1 Tax=Shewanella submarina TaxID=2016376 RepID=A0ABV7GHH3_9GAMM|nr:hypothetical protein [Shewanella submarina]MCL1036463.1 hypothetical protein [Shewanella submarina]